MIQILTTAFLLFPCIFVEGITFADIKNSLKLEFDYECAKRNNISLHSDSIINCELQFGTSLFANGSQVSDEAIDDFCNNFYEKQCLVVVRKALDLCLTPDQKQYFDDEITILVEGSKFACLRNKTAFKEYLRADLRNCNQSISSQAYCQRFIGPLQYLPMEFMFSLIGCKLTFQFNQCMLEFFLSCENKLIADYFAGFIEASFANSPCNSYKFEEYWNNLT